MKIAAALAVIAAAFTLSTPASAQFAKPEDAVKYRQGVMFVIGQHFGRIGAMVNNRAPYDPQAAVDNAEVVAYMARLPWPGFAASTRDLSAPPTKAKPEVWAEPAKFKEHGDKMVDATGKLLVAARTQNLDTLKTAFGNASQTCKGCHDNYRNQ